MSSQHHPRSDQLTNSNNGRRPTLVFTRSKPYPPNAQQQEPVINPNRGSRAENADSSTRINPRGRRISNGPPRAEDAPSNTYRKERYSENRGVQPSGRGREYPQQFSNSQTTGQSFGNATSGVGGVVSIETPSARDPGFLLTSDNGAAECNSFTRVWPAVTAERKCDGEPNVWKKRAEFLNEAVPKDSAEEEKMLNVALMMSCERFEEEQLFRSLINKLDSPEITNEAASRSDTPVTTPASVPISHPLEFPALNISPANYNDHSSATASISNITPVELVVTTLDTVSDTTVSVDIPVCDDKLSVKKSVYDEASLQIPFCTEASAQIPVHAETSAPILYNSEASVPISFCAEASVPSPFCTKASSQIPIGSTASSRISIRDTAEVQFNTNAIASEGDISTLCTDDRPRPMSSDDVTVELQALTIENNLSPSRGAVNERFLTCDQAEEYLHRKLEPPHPIPSSPHENDWQRGFDLSSFSSVDSGFLSDAPRVIIDRVSAFESVQSIKARSVTEIEAYSVNRDEDEIEEDEIETNDRALSEAIQTGLPVQQFSENVENDRLQCPEVRSDIGYSPTNDAVVSDWKEDDAIVEDPLEAGCCARCECGRSIAHPEEEIAAVQDNVESAHYNTEQTTYQGQYINPMQCSTMPYMGAGSEYPYAGYGYPGAMIPAAFMMAPGMGMQGMGMMAAPGMGMMAAPGMGMMAAPGMGMMAPGMGMMAAPGMGMMAPGMGMMAPGMGMMPSGMMMPGFMPYPGVMPAYGKFPTMQTPGMMMQPVMMMMPHDQLSRLSEISSSNAEDQH